MTGSPGNTGDPQAAPRLRAWRDSALVREAVERAGMQSYVHMLSNLSDAFRLRDRAIRCIDGRTPGGVHLAGSGILIGAQAAQEFATAARADAVTYHEDCGAARLWAEQNGVALNEADWYAKEFAEELAKALGVPCRQEPLSGDPGFHRETVVYYDGTGCFDFSQASGLPRGFVVSRRYHAGGPSVPLAEARLAVEIALGELGLRDCFTPASPLRLVPIADKVDPSFSLERLTEELGSLGPPDPTRVLVDGLVAP
jgi:hypothetical protein